ncbi:hypothetical protein CDL15_Pgr004626 [Punica granatum]|uniref:Uncharacterized protein n=1 Tax=Punica granatum TaxID=22663 RepID=A0A218WQT2_PUNGR|nr:hypothetical protein CDL15_Pgr004626 [Punica granatum]
MPSTFLTYYSKDAMAFENALGLELEIEFHGFLEALAAGAVASSGAGAAEALEGEYDCGKEGRKAEGVGDEGEIDVEVDGGVGEEEGDGTEDVGEVGGDEEGAGEDDDDEDQHTGSSCRGKRSETMRKRRRKRGDYGLVIWGNWRSSRGRDR